MRRVLISGRQHSKSAKALAQQRRDAARSYPDVGGDACAHHGRGTECYVHSNRFSPAGTRRSFSCGRGRVWSLHPIRAAGRGQICPVWESGAPTAWSSQSSRLFSNLDAPLGNTEIPVACRGPMYKDRPLNLFSLGLLLQPLWSSSTSRLS